MHIGLIYLVSRNIIPDQNPQPSASSQTKSDPREICGDEDVSMVSGVDSDDLEADTDVESNSSIEIMKENKDPKCKPRYFTLKILIFFNNNGFCAK